MKILTFKVNKPWGRHIFDCKFCNILIDSGAEIAVWMGSAKGLLKSFPQAKREENKKSLVSGFGGDAVCFKDVYSIPSLILRDEDNIELELKNLNVAINDRRVKTDDEDAIDLVIPVIAFRNCNVTFVNDFMGDDYIEIIAHQEKIDCANFIAGVDGGKDVIGSSLTSLGWDDIFNLV